MNDPTQALQALLQAGGATSAFAANSRYHAIATAKLTTRGRQERSFICAAASCRRRNSSA